MDIQLCNCNDLIEHLPSTQAVNFALITSNTFIYSSGKAIDHSS